MHPSSSLIAACSSRIDPETVLHEETALHEAAAEAALRGDTATLQRCFTMDFCHEDLSLPPCPPKRRHGDVSGDSRY